MDESLSFESFLEGAKKAAHSAMTDHGRQEYDEFALRAGVAIERLAKAVLVSKNPIYIAEMRGSAEMLFHLGGHRTASKVRTIGAAEAISRLRMLDILPADRQLDLLIEIRNGVAHASTGDQAKALLPTLAQTVEALMRDIGGPLNAFWGRWTSTARMVVDDRRSQVDRDVQVRIRQARHNFDDRFEGLPEGAKERAIGAAKSRGGPVKIMSGGDVVMISGGAECPACGGPAELTFVPVSSTAGASIVNTDGLVCPLCGLELIGMEEITASGAHTKGVPGTAVPPSMTLKHGFARRAGLELGDTYTG
ncbi:hypothetical protein [Streptomyces lavendofoliae]|uniref:hypothetical protein n=1 Tax=Streptomyces lavendofoliae TaxID=67314 RepID=UPI003D903ADD